MEPNASIDLVGLGLEALSTLAAAFAGAWAAFALEQRRRRKEALDETVGAANRALYTLFNMWNVLKQYHLEVIAPALARDNAWLNMDATLIHGQGCVTFDVDGLSFLLRADGADIFADVLLQEQRYQNAIGLIEHRTNLLLEEAYDRLSAAGIRRGEARPIREIEQILGENIVHQLRETARGISEYVTADLLSLREAFETLRGHLVKTYPDQKFFSVEFVD